MFTIKTIAKNILKKGITKIYHKTKNQETSKIIKAFEKITKKLSSKNNNYVKNILLTFLKITNRLSITPYHSYFQKLKKVSRLVLDENGTVKIIELNGDHNTFSLHGMKQEPFFKGLKRCVLRK